MPHIRAALLAHIPPNQQLLLTELDRVSQELRDHHGQIMGMFVGIVSDFVDASAVKLRTVRFDCLQRFPFFPHALLFYHKISNSI